MAEYFVESALLTHGIPSITEEDLKRVWPKDCKNIAWLDQGEVMIGGVDQFCEFRSRAGAYGRVNYQNFEQYLREKKSGALTASGTMRVCEQRGISLVVTCGIGGFMGDKEAEKCNDMEALAVSPVSMIATAPKDMFDMEATMAAFRARGIPVYGHHTAVCDGYMFCKEQAHLTGCWDGKRPEQTTLLLNPIKSEARIGDLMILEKAVAFGRQEEKTGNYFHPAVNARIDKLTGGYSSRIQLESLLDNIKWTGTM